MKHKVLLSLLIIFSLCGMSAGYSQKTESVSQRRRPVDSFDVKQFAKEIAVAQGDIERVNVYARRWEVIKQVVAYISVLGQVKFSRSVRVWQSGARSEERQAWTDYWERDLKEALSPEGRPSILVRGDCPLDIASTGSTLIHIYGDLNSEVKVGGGSEIIIGGSIKSKGSIKAEGFVRVYVGGSMEGNIRLKGMSEVWINGDLHGDVGTGNPVTEIHVMGDADGKISPTDSASTLKVDVHGSMPWRRLLETQGFSYSEFDASVGVSDQLVGLYRPRGAVLGAWVIHNQGEVSK